MYESADGEVSVDVRLERETVWLTQPQMAELFGRDRSVIARHIRNAYGEQELDPESTSAKFAQVRAEGGRNVSRDVDHYNLDMIISVGYRVKSRRGTQFRIWATRTLREHLVSGYTMNERRLAQRGLHEARQTLDLLSRTLRNQALVDETGSAVLHIITAYTDTWRLLFEYDEGRLKAPASTEPATGALDLKTAHTAIDTLRRDLSAKGESSSLFGNPRDDALEAILGNIEQTMFGEPLYRSREEKAAHLLYFVVKDHPFTDRKQAHRCLAVPALPDAGGHRASTGPRSLDGAYFARRRDRAGEQGFDDPAYHESHGRIRQMNFSPMPKRSFF